MQENDIRFSEQSVKFHILRKLPSFFALKAVISQDLHAERVQDAGSRASDPSETDNAGCLAVQLDHREIPIAPVNVILPFSCFHRVRMMLIMRAYLKQKTYRVLTDDLCSVCRNVHDRNAFLTGVRIIHYVISCSEYGNRLQIRAGIYGRFRNRGLVGNCNICIADRLSDHRRLHIGNSVVNFQFSECFQGFPAQITGIFGISV